MKFARLRADTWWILLLCWIIPVFTPYSEAGERYQAGDGSRLQQLRQFDHIIMTYMRERRVPGASLAISKDGQFLLRKGYGRASSRQMISPWSTFRIGSVSKVITAAGILRLVEQGKLSLDGTVFGPQGVLSEYSPGPLGDQRLLLVTVRHLLQHSAGWDQRQTGDPLQLTGLAKAEGLPEPPSLNLIMRHMMQQQLQHDPGTTYVYSNFGYEVLGKVIQNVTGETYDKFVKHLLWKAGIYNIKQGHTRQADRDVCEVHYYSTYPVSKVKSVFESDGLVPPPYGSFCMENMAASAGWVASAADLVTFLQALNGSADSGRLLSPATFASMIAAPSYVKEGDKSWYGMGLAVEDSGRTWYHSGKLEGSTAALTHDESGFTFAILFNYKIERNDINDLLSYAIRTVPQWQPAKAEYKNYLSIADAVTANGHDLMKIMIPEHKFSYIFTMIATKGYRMTWIDAVDIYGSIFFNTIWTKGDETRWKAYVGIKSSKYRRVFKSKTARGYRLAFVETYVSRRRLRYAAIFVRDTWVPWVTYHGYNPQQHKEKFYEYLQQGYRLNVQSVTEYKGRLYVTAIYHQAPVDQVRVRMGLTLQQYQDELQIQINRGRMLAYVQAYEHHNTMRFSAIFVPMTTTVWATSQQMSKYTLLNKMQDYCQINVPLVCVTGFYDGQYVQFAALWR